MAGQSKVKKLVGKMLNGPAYTPVGDVRSVLNFFGYEQANKQGSHVSYMNKTGEQVTVVEIQGKQVARTYIQRIVDLLNLEEWYHEQ